MNPLILGRPRPEKPHQTGLKPTLRQAMIVVLWSALLLAALRMLGGWGFPGEPIETACLNVAVFVACWPTVLLVILLLILDRRGPVMAWHASCCLAGGGFLAGAALLLSDAVCFIRTGRPTATFPMFPAFGLLCFLGGTRQFRAIWPGRCRHCGRRAVIARVGTGPLALEGWSGKGRYWCASCGVSSDEPHKPPLDSRVEE